MAERGLFQSEASFRFARPVLILLYIAMQVPRAIQMIRTGSGLTTDDAMRLVEVRDLLVGQGWYDLFQHRVLPPEGLSMHWSRYVDAPMAAIMALLQPLFGDDMAARLVAVIWPVSLGVLFLIIASALTERLYGRQAAFLSLLLIIGYNLLSGSGFGVGATDHHSVQILLMLGLFAMIVLPDHPLRRGLAGGVLAALSLAVGLEMILTIALGGIVLVVTHVLRREGSGARLLGFAATLALVTPILMAGQLSPALWSVPMCDAISPPLLAVTTAAFVASGLLVLAGTQLQSTLGRSAAILVVGAATAFVLLPMIQPCLAGPYTAMSPEIQRTVLARIQEIRPTGFFIRNDPGRAISLFMPFYLITLLFAASVLAQRGKGLVLLAFIGMAAVLSFWQMRMLTMGLPLIAIAYGAGITWAFSKGPALKATGMTVLILSLVSAPLGVAYIKATWNGPGPAVGQTAMGEKCNDINQMSALNKVPAAVIYNPINFGPILLLATHHSVTSAPYHRSAEAFVNGTLPFEGEETAFRSAVEKTNADYVLVCRGDIHGPGVSFGTQLSRGESRPWLEEVPIGKSNLRLMRVVK